MLMNGKSYLIPLMNEYCCCVVSCRVVSCRVASRRVALRLFVCLFVCFRVEIEMIRNGINANIPRWYAKFCHISFGQPRTLEMHS